MLAAQYHLILYLTADLSIASGFGRAAQKSADDVGVLEAFLKWGGQRGAWFMGESFIEGQNKGGLGSDQEHMMNVIMCTNLDQPVFYDFANTTVAYPDLIPQGTIINSTGVRYSVFNNCYLSTDLLTPVGTGVAATKYENVGDCTDCISGVYTAYSTDHKYTTLMDAWDLGNLRNQGGGSSYGRLGYFMDVLTNTFHYVCPWTAAPTVDVGMQEANASFINMLGNVRNNPLSTGLATVHFSLAKGDQVDVKVYDVTGRLVKTLASRQAFSAGLHDLTWDGRNDQGDPVSRGVYFTQVKFIGGGFVDAKKVTVLK